MGRPEDAPAYEPIPVSDEEKALIRGGTQILVKNQSSAPFRAFAIHSACAAPCLRRSGP
ncbi:MAG: hypothetical protein HS130_09700 [Deltaproteobacteria bacterium]|nr:hypothetical protein [Deltaproteobacteria bacterium]